MWQCFLEGPGGSISGRSDGYEFLESTMHYQWSVLHYPRESVDQELKSKRFISLKRISV